MYYPMTISHAFGHLLLLNIHNPYDFRDGTGLMLGINFSRTAISAGFSLPGEKVMLRWVDAYLREKLPANAIYLRQTQLLAEGVFEHAPQSALKSFSVHALSHFVFADYPVAGQYAFLFLLRNRLVPLPAG